MIGEIKRGQQQEKPLGIYLVEAGLITSTQVDIALNEQQVSGKQLGEILVAHGWVEQQTIEYLVEKVVLPERQLIKKQVCYPENNQSYKLTTVETDSQPQREESYSLMLLATPSRKLEIHLSLAHRPISGAGGT